MRALVRAGTVDVGLVLRADAEPLDSLGGFGDAPLVVVSDPVRGVAVPMLKGQIQKAYFASLPDVALRGVMGLMEDQFIELDAEQRLADQRSADVVARRRRRRSATDSPSSRLAGERASLSGAAAGSGAAAAKPPPRPQLIATRARARARQEREGRVATTRTG